MSDTNKASSASDVPELPEDVARMGNGLTRWIGRKLLALSGWKLLGKVPNEKQMIVAAAPHTSNWDFVLAMIMVMALGIRISYLMKKEAFFWPLRNLFIWLGGIPLDRSDSGNTVDHIAGWFDRNERIWVVITPEGTRSKVDRWKTGFLRIAEKVDVPVLLVAWDYPSKTVHILDTWDVTGHHETDAQAVREYICTKYTGRFPENQ